MLDYVESEDIVVENIHLTQTAWGQTTPVNATIGYNYYCPLKSNSSTERAPAGCVALAGAQMLYYLHYKFGSSLYAPTYAICTGNVNGYSRQIGGASNTIWDGMPTLSSGNDDTGRNSAAILIAWVGHLVGMNYGNTASSARTEDLVDDVFGFYNISCQYGSYDVATVKQSLQGGMPVVASARAVTGTFLFFDITDGHSFLIDGYSKQKTKKTYHYIWVTEDGLGNITESDSIRTSVTYTNPVITHLKMNWGWGGEHNDNLYAPSGDWEIKDGNGELYNFNRSRKMIFDFVDNN